MNLVIIGLSPNLRKQRWLIVKWTPRNTALWNLNQLFNIFIDEIAFENVVCEKSVILSRPRCVEGNNDKQISFSQIYGTNGMWRWRKWTLRYNAWEYLLMIVTRKWKSKPQPSYDYKVSHCQRADQHNTTSVLYMAQQWGTSSGTTLLI